MSSVVISDTYAGYNRKGVFLLVNQHFIVTLVLSGVHDTLQPLRGAVQMKEPGATANLHNFSLRSFRSVSSFFSPLVL
jgi:hypothetical protein